LYNKNKRDDILCQYLYLLKEDNKNINFNNELKYGLKEGIIRFILNIKNKNFLQNNNRIKISKEKFYNELENMKIKDIDFLFRIFESYSSHFDKYLNYQISFTDIFTFLNDYNLIRIKDYNNSNEYKNAFREKISKAQNNSRNKIIKLKESLHSLDFLFNVEKNGKSKILNANSSYNSISLVDAEILFSKLQHKEKQSSSKSVDKTLSTKNFNSKKEYNLKFRLNFKSFVQFLYLLSNKLCFESFSLFIEFLSFGQNIIKLKNRRINLKYFNDKYIQFDSSELSSDSETNEVLDESIDNTNSTKFQSKEKIFSDEFISPKRIIVEKCPRFFSENTESFKFNKEFQSPKLRIITKNLRK
jgi:hypothetical protein